jgi:hypothetical protein
LENYLFFRPAIECAIKKRLTAHQQATDNAPRDFNESVQIS